MSKLVKQLLNMFMFEVIFSPISPYSWVANYIIICWITNYPNWKTSCHEDTLISYLEKIYGKNTYIEQNKKTISIYNLN